MRFARSEALTPISDNRRHRKDRHQEQRVMSRHLRTVVIIFIVMLCGFSAVVAAGGQIPFLHRGRVEYRAFKDPSGRFSFEFPSDWQPVPGAGDVIASFSEPDGEAALVLARFHMNEALAPEEITDLFAQVETDVLRERQPTATDVRARLVTAGGRRFVVIEYGRIGLTRPERVRQYSFPVGDELLRLTCSAGVELFQKYDPIFVHVADSFTFKMAAATKPAVAPAGAPAAAVAAPSGQQTPTGPQTVRVGGDIPAPVKTKHVNAVYPEAAVKARLEGVVSIEATIGTDGRVIDANVVNSVAGLDEAALRAVRQWEYRPTLVKGVPVRVVMTVRVVFALNARSPQSW